MILEHQRSLLHYPTECRRRCRFGRDRNVILDQHPVVQHREGSRSDRPIFGLLRGAENDLVDLPSSFQRASPWAPRHFDRSVPSNSTMASAGGGPGGTIFGSAP
jgi:hypothetical protein